MIRSRVAIFSLIALLSAGACKDTTGASAGAPSTTTPPASTPPTDKPADPAEKPAENGEPTPAPPTDVAYTECTPDTRKNGICTREYRPVCGKKADDSRQTFPNKCTACSDTAVVGYFEGGCEAKTPEK
jgi:hypothetical protein